MFYALSWKYSEYGTVGIETAVPNFFRMTAFEKQALSRSSYDKQRQRINAKSGI